MGWNGVITFICISLYMWCYVIVWGGVGWDGVITFICISLHIWFYIIVWGGVGWGGVWWGNNIHLHFLIYIYIILYHSISSCTSSHTWCYATVSRLVLSRRYDATLLYVVLHFLPYMILYCTSSHISYSMSSCTFSQIWYYIILYRLALPLYMILRYTSSHIWYYATVYCLALSHRYDAMLLYVVLRFLI